MADLGLEQSSNKSEDLPNPLSIASQYNVLTRDTAILSFATADNMHLEVVSQLNNDLPTLGLESDHDSGRTSEDRFVD